ncbi:MAG: kelch repeat-containing protein [Chryseolinea sp.]
MFGRNLIFRLFCFLIVCSLSTTQSCEDEEEEDVLGNWFAAVDFEGQRRAGAVSFTIGNKAFVGLGYDGDDYFNDFYFYNADKGYWEDVADFPGVLRESAVAFSIGEFGYVGLGYNRDLDTEELADFWEYNSAANTWRQLSDFPSARYGAVAFAINDRGYVGTGNDGDYYLSDFYQYNPEGDQWSEIRGYPGGKREDALGIAFNGKGYVCTGRNNGSYKADMWAYTPETDQWTDLSLDSDDDDEQHDLFAAAVQRHHAVGFAYQDRIFISTGTGGSSTSSSTFEYTPETGLWVEKTPFEGSARSRSVGFVISDRIFIVTGQNGSSYWDNMFEFRPDDEYDDED